MEAERKLVRSLGRKEHGVATRKLPGLWLRSRCAGTAAPGVLLGPAGLCPRLAGQLLGTL